MPVAAIVAAGVLGAGASIYGASQQSGAINDAAAAQTAANQAAIAEQRREFDTNQSNLGPWLSAGKTALGEQMALLGLGALPASTSTSIGSGGPVGFGGSGAGGLSDAQVGQIMSGPYGAGIQQAFQQAQQTSPGYLQSLGVNGLQDYARYWYNNMRNPADYSLPTSDQTAGPSAGSPDAATLQQQAIDNLKGSPLYQSLYRNGQNAILANGSATGGLRGGNMQSSLANFGADTLASVIQQQLSNLGGISGQGASTGGALGQLGAGTSGNISTLLSQGGGIQAGGILGAAGAGVSGFTGAAGALSNTIGRLYGGGYLGGGGGGYGGGPQFTGVANMGAGTDVAGLF